MIEPLIQDPGFTLYIGDNAGVLGELGKEVVDCVVTSPPYYGLRDYGTGHWEGGRVDCTHEAAKKKTRYDYSLASSPLQDGRRSGTDARPALFREVCPTCGARRVDDQLGLEATVGEYIDRLVTIFDQVRGALAAHGTVWVNIGDSYDDGELLGVPWRFAFAMQDSGWRLNRDVIWYKRNPMPESSKRRPTTDHEYLFMFTKTKNHFYDWYAVREKSIWAADPRNGQRISYNGKRTGYAVPQSFVSVGDYRLLRSVWDIPTHAYKGAHFAVFPKELARRCIKASCPKSVCQSCGKPVVRVVTSHSLNRNELPPNHPEYRPQRYDGGKAGDPQAPGPGQRYNAAETVEWRGCDCSPQTLRRGVVLDPFLGSGTTAEVARDLGRDCIGIELNADYCRLAGGRRAQQSLFDLEVA